MKTQEKRKQNQTKERKEEEKKNHCRREANLREGMYKTKDE